MSKPGLVLNPRGKKEHSQLSVQTVSSQDTALVSGPTPVGKRYRDRSVDTNLSSLNLALKQPGRCARVCENGGSVSVPVSVHDIHGSFQRVGMENGEDGSKDFDIVALHALLGLENGRSDPVTIGVSIDLDTSTVENDFTTLFLARSNQGFNLLESSRGNDGSEVGSLFEPVADLERLGPFQQLGKPFLGSSDGDQGTERHASLTGSTKRSSGNGIEGMVLVGIWHENRMVLGTQVGLDSLSIGTCSVVNVLSCSVATDKADRLDSGVVTERIDGIGTTVGNRQDTLGDTGTFGEFDEDTGGSGVTFTGLDDERVSGTNGNGDRPEGNHGGEVEAV